MPKKPIAINEKYFAKIRARIERKIEIVAESGCWIWMGYLGRSGYGRMGFAARRAQETHRVSWIVFRGEIPAGLCVLHRCDIPPCINPDHLFLGTHLDNCLDKIRKGRARYRSARVTADTSIS